MVGVTLEAGFTPRKFLEMTLSRLGTPLLQALPKRMVPFAVDFDGLPAEGLSCAIRCKIHNAQVYAKCLLWFIWRWFRNVKRHGQIEGTVAVDEISLTLDAVKPCLLIAANTERNEYAARERQERNGVQSFEGHHSLVINNSALFPEGRLDALIAFV